MKKIIILVVLAITINQAQAQTSTTDSVHLKFNTELVKAGMTFTMPNGAVEVPIVKNMQMHYEMAVTIPGKAIEVRYAIAPYSTMRNAMKKSQKDGDTTEVFNKRINNMSRAITYSIATNVGGGVRDSTIRSQMFPPEAVKREFGADFGGTILIPVKNNSFGTQYKFCMMIALHKDFAGDGYIMYLGDSLQSIGPIVKEHFGINGGFYALKFKQ
ncbi:hypothetical protein [Mucilaginibacter antarcticus]|uniref:Uncharacterized protein n=1 Tax=Mucilaginibacter antarcticus TaxID=1855725 RepID=A0ABW5XLM1_9SPHI